MKTTTAALITLATLAPIAHADPEIYIRDPKKPSSVQHGLANGHAVLLDIYGQNAIEAAREYGRSLVGHHSFAQSKQLIEARAEELYPGKPAMIHWWEVDCAAGYDQEVRASR